MDVSQIVSEYGPYMNVGQNATFIKKKLYQRGVTAASMTSFKTENDIVELAVGALTDVIQAYQGIWTAKGDLTIIPNKLTLDPIKIDMEIDVTKLHGNWIEFMEGKGILDPVQFPFIAWIVSEHVIPMIQQNIELFGIFKGVTGLVTPGVATEAGASMNGLKSKILANLNLTGSPVLGKINRVVLDAFTSDGSNAFDNIEKFVESIPDAYMGIPMNLYMSYKRLTQYRRDKRNTFPALEKFEALIDGYENITLIGCPSMAGEEIIFLTPKENVYYLIKDESNQNTFKIESAHRLVSLFTQFKLGVGFAVNEAVWAYVPDSQIH